LSHHQFIFSPSNRFQKKMSEARDIDVNYIEWITIQLAKAVEKEMQAIGVAVSGDR